MTFLVIYIVQRAKIKKTAPRVPRPEARAWLKQQLIQLKLNLAANPEPAHEALLMDEFCLTLKTYFSKQTGLHVVTWTSGEFRRELGPEAPVVADLLSPNRPPAF